MQHSIKYIYMSLFHSSQHMGLFLHESDHNIIYLGWFSMICNIKNANEHMLAFATVRQTHSMSKVCVQRTVEEKSPFIPTDSSSQCRTKKFRAGTLGYLRQHRGAPMDYAGEVDRNPPKHIRLEKNEKRNWPDSQSAERSEG